VDEGPRGVAFTSGSSTVVTVNLATAGGIVRARLGTWPHEPDVGHLALADHHMVPDDAHVAQWATRRGLRALRTGALFPDSVGVFRRAGFTTVDSLVLLEFDLRDPRRTPTRFRRTRRMTDRDLTVAASVDQRAFRPRWSNSAASLREISQATPHHRSRKVVEDGRLLGFAISGRAGRSGYLQRLAVDPDAQRRGHGRALAHDALAWMRRHRATTALVNTAADNGAAVALYESVGFTRRPGELEVLELRLEP
jgi:ribosomal protein S18 acetylase RimI-like enzyme